MKIASGILFSIGFSVMGMCQTSAELLRMGDEQYRVSEYSAAELAYRKARQQESSLQSNFNLGNATFKQERYEEAVEHYLNATRQTKDDKSASNTYYNLGNAYFQGQKMEDAIEAYKQAIRLDSDNQEAKYNLTYCKELLKVQQQQEQQQQENSDQNQDSENQENQEQENQDQENQEQQENSDENQEQQDQQEQTEQDSTQQDNQQANFDSTRLEKQTLDSLDAAKLLQIIQSEEQKVQEKLRKYNSNRKKPEKDW